jgi:hypothetical protein
MVFRKFLGTVLPALGFAVLLTIPVMAQIGGGKVAAICDVGSLKFTCPEDFSKLPNLDDSTSLFKFQHRDTVVYFFVSVPSGGFDDTAMANAIGRYYASATPFRWKKPKEPMTMTMKTQLERKMSSLVGFDGTSLISIRSSAFKVDNKNVVFGYVWDDKAGNKQEKFKKAEGFEDQGIGCNAVATTLNSITREFPQTRQYCFQSIN